MTQKQKAKELFIGAQFFTGVANKKVGSYSATNKNVRSYGRGLQLITTITDNSTPSYSKINVD